MSNIQSLDEKIFDSHLKGGTFQYGVDQKKWRLISIEWPYVIIGVNAKTHNGWPTEYSFRFECSDYPNSPVTAQPWDINTNKPLDPNKWPGGKNRVPKVFRPDWKGGACLYLPCDRISIEGHSAWPSKHPHLIWKPTSEITLYLEAIYELINSSDYSGPRCA